MQSFRARAGAAPLKPVFEPALKCMHWFIPRPRGRGPVEATPQLNGGQTILPAFRARAGAAPLKLRGGDGLLLVAFPFRARAGAAPLKHCARAHRHTKAASFRARAGAAPLKRIHVLAEHAESEMPLSIPEARLGGGTWWRC